FMRFVFGLTFALWLSFPLTGVASGPQQPEDTNPAAQSPPAAKQNPPAEQAPAENQEAAAKQQKSDSAAPAAGSPNASPAAVPKKRRKQTPPSNVAPRRIVVREGGATEPAAQIVPGISPAEAARQRQKAEDLLSSTRGQVQQLSGRTMDAQQQETVGQIRNYMEGARAALKEGDVQRAGTLAGKAHLLADDLAKH
ncbi:MAG: hypothetical protein WB566_11940, partial [Terriglobales bacterium]